MIWNVKVGSGFLDFNLKKKWPRFWHIFDSHWRMRLIFTPGGTPHLYPKKNVPIFVIFFSIFSFIWQKRVFFAYFVFIDLIFFSYSHFIETFTKTQQHSKIWILMKLITCVSSPRTYDGPNLSWNAHHKPANPDIIERNNSPALSNRCPWDGFALSDHASKWFRRTRLVSSFSHKISTDKRIPMKFATNIQ